MKVYSIGRCAAVQFILKKLRDRGIPFELCYEEEAAKQHCAKPYLPSVEFSLKDGGTRSYPFREAMSILEGIYGV